MPYSVVYELLFNDTRTEEPVLLRITDMDSFVNAGTFTPIGLTGAGEPVIIRGVDNDEDKFTPIRGKECEIELLSSTTISAETFANGGDNRYRVDAIVVSTSRLLFTGFLVMDDHQRAFLPPKTYTFTLTATDNLVTLKDVELKKLDGARFRGMFRVIDYLIAALAPTNLNLNLIWTDTWLEETATNLDVAWWESIYLEAKTFEAAINESVSCYATLEKILGHNSTLTQHNGQWFINHIDEIQYGTVYRYQYNWQTQAITRLANTTYEQTIGRTETLKFSGKDALVTFVRPYKSVQLNYQYELPLEIIDNIDFSRGVTFLPIISVDMSLYIRVYANLGAFPNPGEYKLTYKANNTGLFYKWNGSGYTQLLGAEVPTGTAYVFDDWTLQRIPSGTVTTAAYVAKISQYGDEKARYVVLQTSANQHALFSNPVPVGRYDKMVFSFDRRYAQDITGGGSNIENVAQIRLYGEDGTFWTVANTAIGSTVAGQWVQSNATFSANTRFLRYTYQPNQSNETEWVNIGVDTDPIPVSGDIRVVLYQADAGRPDVHFSNMQLEYIPFINGSYQKYTGHAYLITQPGALKATYEEEVYINDSPRRIFKGAPFRKVGSNYVLTEQWYAAGDLVNQGLPIPPATTDLKPFGSLQVRAVNNQYNRPMIKLEGSVLNLTLGGDVPDFIHQIKVNAPGQLDDGTSDVTDRVFLATSLEQDIKSSEWRTSLYEVFDTVKGHDYTAPLTFKYLQG